MTDQAPESGESPKSAARAAAMNRAAQASEPAAPAEPEAPAGAEEAPAEEAAPQKEKPTPITEGTGTPSDVSEAARTLAKHRSQLKKEVVEELEAEGAIEPGAVEAGGEEPPAEGEGEEDDGRPPTVAEQKGAEALAREFGPMAVEDPAELPDLPTGFEWVEIPQGHPLRDRGDTHFPSASGPAADYIKSQLNNPIRNRELEAAQARARKLERQIAQAEARRKALESEEAKELEDPELKRLVEDAEQAGYSQKTIEKIKRGFEAQKKDIEESAIQEVEKVERYKDIAQQFRNSVEQNAVQRYDEWNRRGELRPRLNEAYRRYGEYIDAVGKMPDPAEFFRMFLDAEYASDPHVRAAMQKRMQSERESGKQSREEALKEERERLKQEIRDEILAEAEERQSKRDTNPLGRLPRSQNDARTPRDESEGISGLTPGQVKKEARKRALSRLGS